MARKTLKQKLQHKLRVQRQVLGLQHELLAAEHAKAGVTINYELQVMQSVALAHGLMVGLTEAKKHFDIESEQYKTYEKISQGRIAQCVVQLISIGVPADEANKRIIQGH